MLFAIGSMHCQASQEFKVRRLTTPEEVRDRVYTRAAAEGWRPGTLDYVSYYAADKTGFFVGELNGKPIGCISVVKQSHNFAYAGTYILSKEYRGKGYAMKMFDVAMTSIDGTYNWAGDSK